ncbi:uncharacterized protein C20orf85-like [Pomacea canaliculata]|uniref:uncharacterized protein C20orf85-like n=1 Tax=Pomacea canaliculata TaxID=400727 RepID=UPI000D72D84E|nr:uncharacterized protein C20orf85-like [Pomacea canaliculata]
MAASVPSKSVAGCNFVAKDKIWKDHIHHETTASRAWPELWSFLTTNYNDLVKDDFPCNDEVRLHREKVRQEATSLIQVPPSTPIEKYIKVYPSTRPFPKTTSREIGWRSTEKELALERYGKYAKPKGGLVRQLNWPQEAIE